MSVRTPGGYSVRHAVVIHNRGKTVECAYLDRTGEDNVYCPAPHPHAGPNGTGIFVGIEEGTRVLIAHAPQERPYIVGIVPNHGSYFDQSGSGVSVDSTTYPSVSDGEISFRGPSGVGIDLSNGGVAIDGATNVAGLPDLELSQLSEALYVRSNNVYSFSEAGRTIEGVIRRDKSETEDPNDTNTLNFLNGAGYDYNLTDIGRTPDDEVSMRSSQISKITIRNPALTEKHSIVYEFADSFGVRDLISESAAIAKAVSPGTNTSEALVDPASDRDNRRTDSLDLDLVNYNHLIEHTEGTVVDIYGNILDINRHKIEVPGVGASGGHIDAKLSHIYSYLRRSIKYHLELNARKDVTGVTLPILNTSYNAKEYGKWSVDVDGEGLTKINIPASSETGNIPVLGRYVNSRDPQSPESGAWRDPQLIDVRLLPFGAISTNNGTNSIAGAQIANGSYEPVLVADGYFDGYAAIGTAHHNILTIAPSIFSAGKLASPDPAAKLPSVGPITLQVDNSILDLQPGQTYQTNPNANAGGRSLNANLDGSVEISIGADTVDRKSLVLDLAGGVVSHYGRDINGRSLIHQTDGDVLIQVGGQGISSDARFTDGYDIANRPGRIEIHLNRPGKPSQVIIIDEDGMTINIDGNIVMASTGDFSISAGANLLLDGRQIYTYGPVDTSINSDRAVVVSNTERLMSRNGRNSC